MLYMNDSSRVWHVAKQGNDGNSGHASQYPVNLANDAKLTITAAVNAAQSGDVIVIWPGDYAENVNCGTKVITLIGISQSKSKIVPATGDGIVLANDCSLLNLAVEALATNAKAINAMSKLNIKIEDCDIYGAYDGVYFVSASHIFLINSRIRGKYDGGNCGSATGIVAENCIFQGLGTYGTNVPCRGLYGVGSGCYHNCLFLAERNDVSSQDIGAVYLTNNARAVFSNCIFDVTAGAGHTGNVFGVLVNGTNGAAILRGCSARSASSGSPAFGPTDLWLSSGAMIVSESFYSTSSGTIAQGGSGWSAAVKQQAAAAIAEDVELQKAIKMLVNKAVQDKLTGMIRYYDNDGETVVLTHTPSEDDSSITRVVS
jgi:hypothetical protein